MRKYKPLKWELVKDKDGNWLYATTTIKLHTNEEKLYMKLPLCFSFFPDTKELHIDIYDKNSTLESDEIIEIKNVLRKNIRITEFKKKPKKMFTTIEKIDLSPSNLKIMKYLYRHRFKQPIKLKEIRTELKMPKRTCEDSVIRLLNKKMIKRFKGGKYSLTKKGLKIISMVK